MTGAKRANRVALVTGATRGIGAAVARALLRTGRTVVACGRDASRLEALSAEYPDSVRTVRCDLAESGEAARAVDAALAMTGYLDELVCAAGIVRYAGIDALCEADLRTQLEVNLVAPFLMAQRAGLHMLYRGQGAIVFIGSTLGQRAVPDTAAYAVSKAALHHATHAFAIEFAPNVRVNAVSPGVVDTDMVRVTRGPVPETSEASAAALATQLEQLRQLHPLGRLGTPDDIADAVLFLLEAKWITGTILRVDGGLLAR